LSDLTKVELVGVVPVVALPADRRDRIAADAHAVVDRDMTEPVFYSRQRTPS
jgi:hypothetical protein